MGVDPVQDEWTALGGEYRTTITAGSSSSAWLRDEVLKPTVVRLLGERSNDRVLDIGTGGGWLFDETTIGERHACDLALPEVIPPGVRFELADVVSLPYPDGHFDALVASVVLCYCADLREAAKEMARVTRAKGAAVVALVHPYFYRTGQPNTSDDFSIEADLSEPRSFAIHIGGMVGPFTYHLHAPGDYVNAFVEAGWNLRRMEDAFIPRDRYRAFFGNGRDGVARSTKVPLFTFMAFERA